MSLVVCCNCFVCFSGFFRIQDFFQGGFLKIEWPKSHIWRRCPVPIQGQKKRRSQFQMTNIPSKKFLMRRQRAVQLPLNITEEIKIVTKKIEFSEVFSFFLKVYFCVFFYLMREYFTELKGCKYSKFILKQQGLNEGKTLWLQWNQWLEELLRIIRNVTWLDCSTGSVQCAQDCMAAYCS